MGGAIPLLLLYAFVALTGKLYLYYYKNEAIPTEVIKILIDVNKHFLI